MSQRLLDAATRRGVPLPPVPHSSDVLGELAASVYLHPQRATRKMPRELAYLTGAVSARWTTREGEIAAWTWGAAGRPRVALLHGWEGHGAQLGAFAAPLVSAGFQVVTFDAPGHGESPGDECSAPLVGRIAVELAERDGAFHALVAHSMGAAAAAVAAMEGPAPRGLVFLAPPLSQFERLERMAGRVELTDDVRAAFFAAVARRTRLALERADMKFIAAAAPCPLLAFHDPDDSEASFAATEGFVARWAGARLVPCPGRGHVRLLSTPDVVRQGVEFIAGLR